MYIWACMQKHVEAVTFIVYYHYCEHHCNYCFEKPKISLVCKRYNLFHAVKPKENLNLIAFKGITGDILKFMTERRIIKVCLKQRHQNEAPCLPFHSLFNVSLLSGGSTAVLITSRLLQVILWLPQGKFQPELDCLKKCNLPKQSVTSSFS